MGMFSWLYSDSGKQMLDGVYKNSYLLIPEEFQGQYGSYIKETCYEGYGVFYGVDVYDLVADFNRDFIPEILRLADEGKWHCRITDEDRKSLQNFNEGKLTCEKRWLGIMMACYDEDNARLPYPIKITERPIPYAKAYPSDSDLNQGWAEGI